MKRCPECKRDYFDDSLIYCLDDGSMLLEGPASGEAVTAILGGRSIAGNAKTELLPSIPTATARFRPFAYLIIAAVLVIGGFIGYRGYFPRIAGTSSGEATTAPQPSPPKLYWQMSRAEQLELIRNRTAIISASIGDVAVDLDDEEAAAIAFEIDKYVQRKESLSQEQFKEGIRAIYGRASQYAPMIGRAFDSRKVPAALGIYQAMIESEYRDCPTSPSPRGPVGLFQFNRRTAAKYGMLPADYCSVEIQSDTAARYMSDLLSDFGTEKASWTLALLSFNIGDGVVREDLRNMRAKGITERDFWAIRRYRQSLARSPDSEDDDEEDLSYVIRFLAAAIIGETPAEFGLPIPPLTTIES